MQKFKERKKIFFVLSLKHYLADSKGMISADRNYGGHPRRYFI